MRLVVVGTGVETPNGLLPHENKVVGKRQQRRVRKKARKADATEGYGNVGPPVDDVGDADIHDIGDADNDDVSAGMGAGTSGVGCGADAESLPAVDARAVPLASFYPPSAYCQPI